MQALDADKLHCQQRITLLTYMLRIRIYTLIMILSMLALAILISLVLHQQLISEAILDLPVNLQAVPRWSRKCAKAADGELQLICILAFSRHNF